MGLGPGFDEVLGAAQQNAGWAFDRVYRSLAPAVAAYLRAQGVDDPDDVTSEVFLAVFSRIGSFRGDEAQFRSFVFTIAHHRIVDHRRRAARRPPPQSLEEHEDWATQARPSAEEEGLSALGFERLRAVLDRLAPDQRDVVVMRVIADLSVEDVAAALGKKAGAVKALQRRGLAALRRHLAGEDVSS